MLDPYENFETWMFLAQDSLSDPIEFAKYHRSFESMLASIANNGFLDHPISHFTSSFLEKISSVFVKRMLFYIKLPTVQMKEVKRFLELFLTFSIYGLDSMDLSAIKIAIAILDEKQQIYTTSRQFFSSLCRFYIGQGALSSLNCLISSHAQTVDILSPAFTLVSVLYKYQQGFDYSRFFRMAYNTLDRVVNKSHTAVNVESLVGCIEKLVLILHAAKELVNEFVDNILPLLFPFLKSDTFNSRNHCCKAIKNLFDDNNLKKPIALFFSDPTRTVAITQMPLHAEYAKDIGAILTSIATLGKVHKKVIKDMWNRREYLHSSERQLFFEIFVQLANAGKIKPVYECIMSVDPSVEWFHNINSFCNVISQRNDSDEYLTLIREELWKHVFNTEFEFQSMARDSLLKILGYHATEEDFEKVSQLMFDEEANSYVYSLIEMIILNSGIELNEEQLNQLYDQAIGKILSSNPPNGIYYELIQTICQKKIEYFTDEQLVELAKLRQVHPNYFEFLSSLVKEIDPHDLSPIASKIPPEEFNMNFFNFVKNLEKGAFEDKLNVESLPLPNEELLWRFSLTESPIRDQFAIFLCKLYSKNDGEKLTDEDMIKAFLDKWETYIGDDHSFSPELVNLLNFFIMTIENNMYRGPQYEPIHNCNNFQYQFSVFVKSQVAEFSEKFNANGSTRVAAIIEQLAERRKRKIHTIQLVHDIKKVKRTDFVSMYNYANGQVHFDCEFKLTRKLTKIHKRTTIPSIYVLQRPWINDLFHLLELDNSSASDLFSNLPKVDGSFSFYKHINDNEPIDYYEVFPLQCPYVFYYNFTTLNIEITSNQIPRDKIVQLGLMDALINIICQIHNESNCTYQLYNCLIYNFLMFLNLVTITFTQLENPTLIKLFNFLINLIIEFDRNGNHDMLEYTKISFTSYFHIANNQIPCPENYIDTIESLLNCQKANIRQFAYDAFSRLNIPIEHFMLIMEKNGTNLSEEFLLSLLRHFNNNNKEQNAQRLSEMVLDLLQHSSGNSMKITLELIHHMLVYQWIPIEMQYGLFEYLNQKFLNYNVDEMTRVAFEPAVSCLILLSNLKDDNGTIVLKNILEQFHQNRTPFSKFGLNGDECTPSHWNKVGLKNLGMTCFLNSILQQFFAIKPLRNSIMAYDGNDLFIKELSKLFTLMRLAKVKSVSTQSLVDHWKNWDDTPLNPRVQQDAVEFLQILVDKLEAGPDTGKMCHDLLCGFISHHFTGLKVEYSNINREPFSTIDIEVQKTPDIINGFNNFIKPDYFIDESQYIAESLHQKIDAQRVSTIEEAPPILILHLKRFKYNYTTQERDKLNDKFEIFPEIDITPYSQKPFPTYHLIGIIIHRGTALSGHYTSFIKNKKLGIWLLFDDETIFEYEEKDVLKQASGSNGDSNGYILFYEREHNISYPKPDFSDSIKEEVQNMISENQLISLVCSSGYLKLMKGLLNQNNLDYLSVIIKFLIDSHPFTKFTQESEELYKVANQRIKMSPENQEEFINRLLDKFYQSCIFYTPDEKSRSGIVDLLETSLNYVDPLILSEITFSMIDLCFVCVRQFDQIFRVLNTILLNFPDFNHDGWDKRLSLFISNDLAGFFQNNPQLRPNYLLLDMNFTHFLELAVNLDIQEPLSKPFKQEMVLFYLCLSKSNPSSIAKFIKKYYNTEMFCTFLEANSQSLNILNSISLLFFIIPDKAVELSLKLKFKVMNRMSDYTDVSAVISYLASTNDFVKDILKKSIETWLSSFLFDESNDTRNNTITIIFCLIPSNVLESYAEPETPNDLILPQDNTNLIGKEMCDQFANDAREVLKYALNAVPILISIIKKDMEHNADEDYEKADTFLKLIELLLQISRPTGIDFKPLNELLEVMVNTYKDPFNESIGTSLKIIQRFDLDIDQEFLYSIALCNTRHLTIKRYDNFADLLPSYLSLVSRFPPDQDFIKFFLEYCAFFSLKSTIKVKEMITNYILVLLKNKEMKDFILEMIDEKIDKYTKNNYLNVLLILKETGTKRPLFPYLQNFYPYLDSFGINDILQQTFELTVSGDEDKEFAQKLLDERPDINEENKKRLKKMIK